MAPQESMPNAQARLSRQQRRFQSTLPLANILSQKLSSRVSSDGSDDTSPRSSPKKKKIRSQTPSDVLKELAADAIQEMKEQGFLDQPEYDSQCDDISSWYSRMGDRYEGLVANSSQVTIDDCNEPQSPGSFFDRIGLKGTARPKLRKARFLPPELPPILEEQSKSSSQISMCPSECSTPESGPSRRKPLKSIGNVTPATAEAAQYLLHLRG